MKDIDHTNLTAHQKLNIQSFLYGLDALLRQHSLFLKQDRENGDLYLRHAEPGDMSILYLQKRTSAMKVSEEPEIVRMFEETPIGHYASVMIQASKEEGDTP